MSTSCEDELNFLDYGSKDILLGPCLFKDLFEDSDIGFRLCFTCVVWFSCSELSGESSPAVEVNHNL